METIMNRFLAAIVVVLFSAQAIANGSGAFKVTGVRIDANGLGMVIFDQPLAGTRPSCVVSAYTNALAFDTSTAAGKSIMALAVAAKATGDTVGVYGNGVCSIYGGSYVEDWSYGVIQ